MLGMQIIKDFIFLILISIWIIITMCMLIVVLYRFGKASLGGIFCSKFWGVSSYFVQKFGPY
jgi:hypothetical protein